MIKIALCGNIASGKSVVQKFLQDKGYKVLDTDDTAHELLTVRNEKLYNLFKNFEVFEDGEFSRKKLANLVFNDEKYRNLLNSIMHPQIAFEIKKFFNRNSSENYVFVGIPLLFETKMEYLFDKIIFIYADDEIRLERLLKRNNYTHEQAFTRMKSQMPQHEKINRADIVINNNGSIDDLNTQIEKMLRNL